jgi:hypothetical protein
MSIILHITYIPSPHSTLRQIGPEKNLLYTLRLIACTLTSCPANVSLHRPITYLTALLLLLFYHCLDFLHHGFGRLRQVQHSHPAVAPLRVEAGEALRFWE